MQQHSKLVSSGSCDGSFISEGEDSGVTDEEALTVGLHDETKAVAFGLSRCDYLDSDNKSSAGEPEMGALEKTIYVHVICMGKSLLEEEQCVYSGIQDATNDWYVIERGSGGRLGRLKMSRVFEDINQFNYPDPALDCTGCQVIGSCIYVIGGRSVFSQIVGDRISERGSSMIRYLDTHNPRNGWMTLPLTLPFAVNDVGSVVVDDQWLYLLGGFYDGGPCHWGYAVNVMDVNGHGKKEEHEARTIIQPGIYSAPPIVSTTSSPGTLVAYKERESTLYHLDCTKNVWTVYEKDLPYTPSSVQGGATAADGILYIYDSFDMHFISYDIPNRKQLYLINLPDSFWFGREQAINLIVLAENKFCIIWQREADELNHMHIYYVGFSVSFDHLNKPTIVIEEKQSFYIAGYKILNVVAVDPLQQH